MSATTVNLQQQSYNHQQNIPKTSSPYFQQMIGNYIGQDGVILDEKDKFAPENKHHNPSVAITNYDGVSVNDTTAVPPPIPPPPIITPTNSTQGPSWC